MEEQSHLEEEYVQEFVLDHLEEVVKREVSRSEEVSDPNNNEEVEETTPEMTRLPSLHPPGPATILMPPQMSPTAPHPQLLTPPTHSGDEQPFSVHPSMRIRYPATPGTPPDTPPVSNSPDSPEPPYNIGHLQQPPPPHPHPHLVPVAKTEMDTMWIPHPQVIRQEPLDLRPHCTPEALDWSVGQNHPSVIAGKRMHPADYEDMMHYGKRLRSYQEYQDIDSMSPGTPHQGIMGLSKSSMMGSNRFDPIGLSDTDMMDDDLLTTLTVRDLNKKLHGFPREIVAKLKQKRRTLKNRGYAQNCRSKRIQQKHELEIANNNLRREIERLKTEIQMLKNELHRATGDRDIYHHRCEVLQGSGEEIMRRQEGGQDWGQ